MTKFITVSKSSDSPLGGVQYQYGDYSIAVSPGDTDAVEFVQTIKQALQDKLTGFPRRESFTLMFKQQVFSCKRNKQPLSLCILDIDLFKRVNDSQGHVAGDNVLQQFASIIKNSIRASDSAFRYGGEEFVFLLPNTDSSGASILLNRIREKIKNATFINDLKISFSAGIYEVTDGVENEMDLYMESADKALYEAKNTGRDKIVVYIKNTSSQQAG